MAIRGEILVSNYHRVLSVHYSSISLGWGFFIFQCQAERRRCGTSVSVSQRPCFFSCPLNITIYQKLYCLQHFCQCPGIAEHIYHVWSPWLISCEKLFGPRQIWEFIYLLSPNPPPQNHNRELRLIPCHWLHCMLRVHFMPMLAPGHISGSNFKYEIYTGPAFAWLMT